MLKVVIDANIWISALLNSSKALQVVSLLENNQFQLVCAEALVEELAEVLARPKFQTKIQQQRKESLCDLIREKAQFLELPINFDKVCRDPKDDVYIVCAVVGQADLLVSGDEDLLILKEHEGVKIISLASFVEIFC